VCLLSPDRERPRSHGFRPHCYGTARLRDRTGTAPNAVCPYGR
jgi:hypothetical protein